MPRSKRKKATLCNPSRWHVGNEAGNVQERSVGPICLPGGVRFACRRTRGCGPLRPSFCSLILGRSWTQAHAGHGVTSDICHDASAVHE